MKKLSARSVAKLHNAYLAIDAKCKTLYAKADAIENRLVVAGEAAGLRLPLPGDFYLELEDSFVDRKTGLRKNVAYKVVGLHRYKFVVRAAGQSSA